jgi:TPR repeat protein
VDPDKRHLIQLKVETHGEFGGSDTGRILGVEMADGTFVPYTNGMKIGIYRKRAETGDLDAQERLASALWEDSPTNHVEAYKWAAIAASQGRKSGKDLVREFELFMTLDEVAQGKAASAKRIIK